MDLLLGRRLEAEISQNLEKRTVTLFTSVSGLKILPMWLF